MTAIKGPGLGEKNNELKKLIVEAIKQVIRATNEMHLSARFHNDLRHDGRSWRRCKSWACADTVAYVARITELYPLNHNPHALREYRKGLRKLQRTIKATPRLSQVVEEYERKA